MKNRANYKVVIILVFLLVIVSINAQSNHPKARLAEYEPDTSYFNTSFEYAMKSPPPEFDLNLKPQDLTINNAIAYLNKRLKNLDSCQYLSSSDYLYLKMCAESRRSECLLYLAKALFLEARPKSSMKDVEEILPAIALMRKYYGQRACPVIIDEGTKALDSLMDRFVFALKKICSESSIRSLVNSKLPKGSNDRERIEELLSGNILDDMAYFQLFAKADICAQFIIIKNEKQDYYTKEEIENRIFLFEDVINKETEPTIYDYEMLFSKMSCEADETEWYYEYISNAPPEKLYFKKCNDKKKCVSYFIKYLKSPDGPIFRNKGVSKIKFYLYNKLEAKPLTGPIFPVETIMLMNDKEIKHCMFYIVPSEEYCILHLINKIVCKEEDGKYINIIQEDWK